MQHLRLFFVVLWVMIVVTLRRLLVGRAHPAWRWRKEMIAHLLRMEGRRVLRRASAGIWQRPPQAHIPRAVADRLSSVEPDLLGDLAVEITVPQGWREGDSTVLYLHGGGYIFCSPATHRDLVARIAVAAGARCVSLDYRLAPDHPFPAALEDARAAFLQLVESGAPAERLVIAGDSAGGGLSLATMLRLRAEGHPLPAAAVLLSPWVDLECTGESIDTNGRIDYLERPFAEHCAEQYLQGHDPRDPLASPLHADLTGLPPLMVLAGGAEALFSEIALLSQQATAAGVEVTLEVGKAMFHVWPAFASVLPESRPSIRQIGELIRGRTGR
jgi:acetyl esterase/lipase